MSKKIDLVGQRFGRLVVVEEAGRSNHRKVLWKCRCDCGNETVACSNSLRSGNTTSCGCFQHERLAGASTKHGLYKHPLYTVWKNLMKRTGVYKGADDEILRNYIERGIAVCDEWKTFENFYNWALSHGYEQGLQLDRENNDRGYCPTNCRFVSAKQNTNNRRCTLRLDDGTPLAEFVSSLGIQTSSGKVGPSAEYGRIRTEFVRHGSDEAMMRAYGEAIASRFDGTEFVPFRKMFKA